MKEKRGNRRLTAGIIGIAAAAAAAGTVAHPLHTAAATVSGCPLWADTNQDGQVGGQAPNQAQLDIVGGAMSDDGSNLTTTLTISNLSTTPAGGSANEYYLEWAFGGTTYFTNAEISPAGTTYTYGTDNATTGFSTLGTATGSMTPGANGTVSVTVPLSSVGNPPAGSVFDGSSITGKSGVLEGGPSNPSGVSGGGIIFADQDTATSGYTTGQACGSAPAANTPEVPWTPVLLVVGGGLLMAGIVRRHTKQTPDAA